VDLEKVKAITNWSRPRSITDVRSFLGACQYLRKFIRHFSVLASPLHTLTKINNKFEWSNKHEDTFMLLKRKISEAPVLALPNFQEGKPVAYHSKMFQGAQKNYPTYDKELLALHQAVKHWRCYLLGKETVEFNIVIKYKKGSQNKLADMLSRPPVAMLCLSVFMQVQLSSHDEYASEYANDPDFIHVIEDLESGNGIQLER
ncbi:hypothetical protein Tco_0553762, partial [Tanacetum coccineum]